MVEGVLELSVFGSEWLLNPSPRRAEWFLLVNQCFPSYQQDVVFPDWEIFQEDTDHLGMCS